MSIIRLGVERTLVTETGTMQLQRSTDVWEIEVPDDGSEFLASIWMDVDGMEVLRLPLTIGPVLTRLCVPDTGAG